MNYRSASYMLGQILLIVAGLLLIPFIMTFGYCETGTTFGFGITILSMTVFGFPFVVKKPKDLSMSARGGFITVGLAWLLLSLFGAMPFALSNLGINYLDALFEIVSGFTTTGASILSDVELLPKSILFWRSFSNWIGGMGVLVFVIAVLPKTNAAIVHLAKAEIPGPQFGKLVSKLRFTARILYGIYILLSLVQIVALLISGMDVFDSFLTTFSTAGTGGFSCKNNSIASYNSIAVEIIVTVFMFLFSINMNLFYFMMIGRVKQAVKNEELHWLIGYMLVAMLIIVISLSVNHVYETFGETLRYASFQVISIGSSTGFSTADFTTWPVLCQMTLFVCMFFGGMAGSTAGGLKVSRIIILIKSSFRTVKKSISPRTVVSVKIDRHSIDENIVKNTFSYTVLFAVIFFLSALLVTVFESNGDFTTSFTSVATCINNVGPGLSAQIGPSGNFGALSYFSKIVLIFDMLLGRLEIFPIVLLFYYKSWQRI